MTNYQRVLVCLDDLDRDRFLLDYVVGIVETFETKIVHILYVNRPTWQMMMVPTYATDFLPPMEEVSYVPKEDLRERQTIEAKLEELGQRFFGGFTDCKIICNVVGGSPLVEIVSYAMERQVDMLVVGRHFGKAAEKGDNALFTRRITRRATCSVLTLPVDAKPRARNILVPCRDSACSLRALRTAVEIARATHGKIEVLNVFGLPTGFAATPTDYSFHLSVFEEAAHEECRRLIQKVDVRDVEILTRCESENDIDPAAAILARQKLFDADLIVIGARGRTGAAGVLLGTVTEQLIRKSPVPVLAVKQKGECIGLVQALREIWGGKETQTQ